MNKSENYLIFAHYHSDGLMRKDLLNFLGKTKGMFKEVVLISTKLRNKEKLKIPKEIKVIKRKNVGYDFYSYKVGFKYFINKFKKNLSNKNLFFINSSILFVDSNKLIKTIRSIKIKKDEIWGLSKSYELAEHIQSYFFCYQASIYRNINVLKWWNKIKVSNKRQDIVFKYELGLSHLMINNNIKLCSLFKKNLNLKAITIFQKIKQRFREIFLNEIKLYKKNPTNYFWKDFYYKFGIVKVELIKVNPKKINLTKLRTLLNKNGNLEMEALNN